MQFYSQSSGYEIPRFYIRLHSINASSTLALIHSFEPPYLKEMKYMYHILFGAWTAILCYTLKGPEFAQLLFVQVLSHDQTNVKVEENRPTICCFILIST